jgi:hypothetical protein
VNKRRRLGLIVVLGVAITAAAFFALWRINHDTNVIPLLLAELEASNEAPTYGRILTVFGEMGPGANAAIPVIMKTIQDRRGTPNPHGIDIPEVGLKASKKIDPEAAEAGVK